MGPGQPGPGAQLSGAQFATDNWAPDNRAPGPNCPGPNCPGPNLPRTMDNVLFVRSKSKKFSSSLALMLRELKPFHPSVLSVSILQPSAMLFSKARNFVSNKKSKKDWSHIQDQFYWRAPTAHALSPVSNLTPAPFPSSNRPSLNLMSNRVIKEKTGAKSKVRRTGEHPLPI